MKKVKNETHSWTKDEIKMLGKLWTSQSSQEIADKMGLRKEQVSYMANEIRKVYPKLIPKKHREGYMRNLIVEALG